MKPLFNKIVIGIDESYTRTGISICADNKLLKVRSINFKGLKNKTDKRNKIKNVIKSIIKAIKPKLNSDGEIIIICERIRTFSTGFLSVNYIKSTAALVAVIVDEAKAEGIKTYSVDTRAWKSKIVGTSKNKDKKQKKAETMEFVKKLGFDVNDDAADSACIALYGFLPKQKQNLKLED